ncbi:hypothetical protein A616_28740 [Brevibacillus brevis X23]|nr:hypothetical protein A616_28740 [Brevibacillus brevis X23]
MSEIRHYTAEEICAFLTTKAYPRKMFPALEYDDQLRETVRQTLDRAGYEFVDDPISKHFDARIKPYIRDMGAFMEDQLSGLDLTIQAKAILAILWCHLILPQYDRQMRKHLHEEPTVNEDQLYENYKMNIGSRQNLRRILTMLRQYDFIQNVWGQNAIKAGPRLTTSLDSHVMYNRLKNRLVDFIGREMEEQKQAFINSFDQVIDQREGEYGNGDTIG